MKMPQEHVRNNFRQIGSVFFNFEKLISSVALLGAETLKLYIQTWFRITEELHGPIFSLSRDSEFKVDDIFGPTVKTLKGNKGSVAWTTQKDADSDFRVKGLYV